MPGTGSGLDAQIGFGAESTWATAVTPTRFMEFTGESLEQPPSFLDSAGLRAGVDVKRSSRTKVARYEMTGDVNMEVATLGMGLFVKHSLGSSVTTTTVITAPAYKQIHTLGGLKGLGLTTQVGRTDPNTGTVVPFTYSGNKVSKWTFDVKDNAIPMWGMTFVGQKEVTTTALAGTSYLANSSVFSFAQATLKLGGTAATASGETTITGGTVPATVIKSINITGDNAMDTDRYGIGNGGYRKEPLQNGIRTITGKLDAEFDKTVYDLFTAGAAVPLQIDLVGDTISGANKFLFSIILPSVFIKKASPQVGGPEIVPMSMDFEAEWDETNPAIQVKIVSTEASTI